MKSPTTIQTFLQQTPQSNVGIKYNINLNQSNFKETIDYLVANYDFEEIIETGTFNGLGSTSVFARTGKYVFSIECNKNNYERAVSNLQEFANVCVIHGLSIDRNKLVKFLLNEDFKDDTTYDSDYPKAFYMREIIKDVVVENALNLFANNERKQLVFLDSAGGVGYLEFCEFMSYEVENKILVLDDINHIKHKRSVEYLEKSGFEVNKSSDNRFAWCDLSEGKLKKQNSEKNATTNILSK